MVMVRNGICRGQMSERSTHNIHIERFWREHNVDAMIHFKRKLERLEHLGHVDPDGNTDLWLMHYVFICFINKKLMNSSIVATTIICLLQVTKVLTTFGLPVM